MRKTQLTVLTETVDGYFVEVHGGVFGSLLVFSSRRLEAMIFV